MVAEHHALATSLLLDRHDLTYKQYMTLRRWKATAARTHSWGADRMASGARRCCRAAAMQRWALARNCRLPAVSTTISTASISASARAASSLATACISAVSGAFDPLLEVLAPSHMTLGWYVVLNLSEVQDKMRFTPRKNDMTQALSHQRPARCLRGRRRRLRPGDPGPLAARARAPIARAAAPAVAIRPELVQKTHGACAFRTSY